MKKMPFFHRLSEMKVFAAVALRFALADGYASEMLAGSNCGLSMTVGTVIMSSKPAESGTRSVWFSDSSGNALACGVDEYVAGDT